MKAKTEKLMKIKNQIEDAKVKSSEIKGKKSALESQIKQTFNIDVSEIDSELDRMAEELDEKEAKFQEGMEKLEKEFPGE